MSGRFAVLLAREIHHCDSNEPLVKRMGRGGGAGGGMAAFTHAIDSFKQVRGGCWRLEKEASGPRLVSLTGQGLLANQISTTELSDRKWETCGHRMSRLLLCFGRDAVRTSCIIICDR